MSRVYSSIKLYLHAHHFYTNWIAIQNGVHRQKIPTNIKKRSHYYRVKGAKIIERGKHESGIQSVVLVFEHITPLTPSGEYYTRLQRV